MTLDIVVIPVILGCRHLASTIYVEQFDKSILLFLFKSIIFVLYLFDTSMIILLNSSKSLSDAFVDIKFNIYILDLGYEVIPKDMYLVLGDNREDSLDSREIGLVKEKEILGKVDLRIWPIFRIRNEK